MTLNPIFTNVPLEEIIIFFLINSFQILIKLLIPLIGTTMGSNFGPSFSLIFFFFFQDLEKFLDNCLCILKLHFIAGTYIIFLFYLKETSKHQSFWNLFIHIIILNLKQNERETKQTFLDIKVLRVRRYFGTNIYKENKCSGQSLNFFFISVTVLINLKLMHVKILIYKANKVCSHRKSSHKEI